MTLKNCTKCKALNTTKNAQFKGRDEVALYFNCLQICDGEVCNGTFIIRAKNWQKIMEEMASESTASAIMNRKGA